jgi:hypothetical protein
MTKINALELRLGTRVINKLCGGCEGNNLKRMCENLRSLLKDPEIFCLKFIKE